MVVRPQRKELKKRVFPGIAPTGKRVEVPLVAIVRFRDGKLTHNHIYWDQASVIVHHEDNVLDCLKLISYKREVIWII